MTIKTYYHDRQSILDLNLDLYDLDIQSQAGCDELGVIRRSTIGSRVPYIALLCRLVSEIKIYLIPKAICSLSLMAFGHGLNLLCCPLSNAFELATRA